MTDVQIKCLNDIYISCSNMETEQAIQTILIVIIFAIVIVQFFRSLSDSK